MSKYEDPTQLDYRYGGDTVDDFAQKYMKTVAYIFSALNELRSPTGGTLTQNPEAYQLKVDDNKLYIRNQANTDWILLGDVQENFGFRTSASDAFMHESDVADSGTAGKLIRADASGKLNADILGNAAKIADKAIQMGLDLADEDRLVYDKDTDTITNRPLQFKVDGDKIYARNDATTSWVLLGDLKQNLGFRSSTDDAFLTESDVADNGTAGKLIRADVNGKLNADILGNARKMAGKTFAPEDLQDGQIPVYRASDGTWHAENKGTVGTGKNLMIMDGDKMLGEYNGDEMKAIDIQKSSLTKALAESTGYGIVSGCEPSINGLTVTVGAGVIHTADGRRVEVPEQSITLDAADATKPRTDVVYLDKYGKIAKLTGELGTPAVTGSNTYTISTNFAAGDTVTFGGVVFTCTTSTQDATNFALGTDTATSAQNLATALNANSTINAIYMAHASGSVIIITEKAAGNSNTPGTMIAIGTGVISSGNAVQSRTEAMPDPTLGIHSISVCTVKMSVDKKVEIIASYTKRTRAHFVYDTVKQMIYDEALQPGEIVRTLGYYTANDRGGATYILRSRYEEDIVSTTVDGCTSSDLLILLKNGLVAELLLNGLLNARQIGCGNKNTIVNNEAIITAIKKGNSIFFPQGMYCLSDTLRINCECTIKCDRHAIFVPASDMDWLIDIGNNYEPKYFDDVPIYAIDWLLTYSWEGGVLYCQHNGHRSSSGFRSGQAYHSSVQNLMVHDATDIGVAIEVSNTSLVSGAYSFFSNIVVKNNTGLYTKYGFYIDRFDQSIDKCSAINCKIGFYINKSNISLYQCTAWLGCVDKNTWNETVCFYLSSTANLVRFYNCMVDTMGTGFQIDNPSFYGEMHGVLWINNNKVNDQNKTGNYCVLVKGNNAINKNSPVQFIAYGLRYYIGEIASGKNIYKSSNLSELQFVRVGYSYRQLHVLGTQYAEKDDVINVLKNNLGVDGYCTFSGKGLNNSPTSERCLYYGMLWDVNKVWGMVMACSFDKKFYIGTIAEGVLTWKEV